MKNEKKLNKIIINININNISLQMKKHLLLDRQTIKILISIIVLMI